MIDPNVCNDKTLELIEKVGDDLLGTCKSADQVIGEVFECDDLTLTDLHIDLLHRLD